MNITAKQIEKSNAVIVFPKGISAVPETGAFYGLQNEQAIKGSGFSDDQTLGFRLFDLPALKYKYVFEAGRMMVEDTGFRKPEEAGCAKEIYRIWSGLSSHVKPAAYGFNFDLVYRTDAVIPQREILKPFLKERLQDNVRDFGWQFSLTKDKGRITELYFFKVVSPLEISVHANFHFVGGDIPDAKAFQALMDKCYTDMDEIMSELVF